MARPLTSTNTSDRLGPVARPGAEERASSISLTQGLGNGTRAWGDNGHIWGQGLGSSTRDSSRSRGLAGHAGVARLADKPTDAASFLASNGPTNTAAPTANSFGPTLNTDVWNRHRAGWDSSGMTPQNRSSGVSPVRRSSGVGLLEDSQPLHDTRPNGNARTTNGLYGTTSLTGQRYSDAAISGGFGHYTRSSNDSAQAPGSLSSWADGGSVHSPTDDRRSVANSDTYLPSRNSSLPPSRHGNEPSMQQVNESPFGRLGHARTHNPSISSISSRYGDHRNSIHNDNLPQLLNRVSLDGESDQLLPFQRQALNPQSPLQALGGSVGTYLQTLQDSPASDRPIQGLGSYTSESAPNFNNPFSRQPFERSATTPGANDFRQSSYFSTNGTPSAVDRSYPQSAHPGQASTSANPALLERRLRVVQQEQTNGLLPHVPFQPSALNPYRQPYAMNGYTPPYGMPNGLQINPLSLAPHLAGYGQSNMYPMLETSRPRREGDGLSLQSQMLSEFKVNNNNKGAKMWQLKDIQGHVVEFCGDQLGSRFIQTKLETANSDDKQLVFTEILPDVIQLMQDVFGNYVIQKFFDHGDQSQKGQIAAAMKGHLFELSTQMYACRVVQKAIDHILTSQQAALIREMEPHVLRCVKDMNGNHVIQKAIERIPAEHIQFIVDAFTGKVGELATHAYGCRVIQRVLEHAAEPVKRTILTELHSIGPALITDQYGNYVTQHMIVYGFPEDREKTIRLVRANLLVYSKHKFASNVVEKCFSYGSPQNRHDMLMVMVEARSDTGAQGQGQGSGLLQLIKDGFGNYVVQKMLDTLKGDDYRLLVETLEPEVAKAKRSMAGKHIAAVEKKMHRRTASTGGVRSNRSDSIQSPISSVTSPQVQPKLPLPRINLEAPPPVVAVTDVSPPVLDFAEPAPVASAPAVGVTPPTGPRASLSSANVNVNGTTNANANGNLPVNGTRPQQQGTVTN